MKQTSIVLGIIFLLVTACVKPKPILPEKNPEGYKQEEAKVYSGQELYQQKCVSCHGSDGKLGVAGAKDITASMLSLDERIQLITNGKNTMPAFGPQLSEEEIKKVAEYSVTLK